MPLILAIEPDRRQANQLNAVVRSRLQADLVLAESAERALAALGDRVPDLILTSALLSPTDELVLGERLRALDGVAAHVQTLTIPVLAGARPRSRRAGGMLSVLRLAKPKEDEAPDGCDPTIFASQCAEYLERAVAERASKVAAARHDAEDTHDAIAQTVEPLGQRIDRVSDPVEPVDEWNRPIDDLIAPRPEPVEASRAAFEPIRESFESIRETVEPLDEAFEPIHQAFEPIHEAPAPIHEPFEPILDAAEPTREAFEPIRKAFEPIREAFESIRETFAPANERTFTPMREPIMPVIIDAPAATATVQEAIAQIEAYVAREALAADTIARVEADNRAIGANEFFERHMREQHSDAPEKFIELDLSTLFDDASLVEPVAARGPIEPVHHESAAFDEWDNEPEVYDINVGDQEIVDALPLIVSKRDRQDRQDRQDRRDRQDRQDGYDEAAAARAHEVLDRPARPARPDPPARLGVSQLWPPMAVASVETSLIAAFEDPRAVMSAHTASARAQARHKPVQDEWGFFDPQQCGFAALLAKLDEILETEDRQV